MREYRQSPIYTLFINNKKGEVLMTQKPLSLNIQEIMKLTDEWEKDYYISHMLDGTELDDDDNFEYPDTPEQRAIDEQYRKTIKEKISPFDKDIKIGEIRVLNHKLCSEYEHVPHILVFAEKDDDYLIIPFSKYNHAGTNLEVVLQNCDMLHNVLQCTNVRRISKNQLENSWLCQSLDPSDFEKVVAMMKHICGWPLPKDFKNDGGKLPGDSTDPRWAYMTEQFNRFPLLKVCSRGDILNFKFSNEPVCDNTLYSPERKYKETHEHKQQSKQ